MESLSSVSGRKPGHPPVRSPGGLPAKSLGERTAYHYVPMQHDVPPAGCSRARPPRLSRVSQFLPLPGPPDAAVSATPSPRCPGLTMPSPPAARGACRHGMNSEFPNRLRLSPSRRPPLKCAARGRRRYPQRRTRPCSRLRRPYHTRASKGARASTNPCSRPPDPLTRGSGVDLARRLPSGSAVVPLPNTLVRSYRRLWASSLSDVSVSHPGSGPNRRALARRW